MLYASLLQIDKVQDLLGNNEQEIHDMRIYIQDLEERSGTLEYENNQIKHNTSKVSLTSVLFNPPIHQMQHVC